MKGQIIFDITTLVLRRMLIELRYRRAVKKYSQGPLWEIMRVPVEVSYALEKGFL